jgi:hypothetical protein
MFRHERDVLVAGWTTYEHARRKEDDNPTLTDFRLDFGHHDFDLLLKPVPPAELLVEIRKIVNGAVAINAVVLAGAWAGNAVTPYTYCRRCALSMVNRYQVAAFLARRRILTLTVRRRRVRHRLRRAVSRVPGFV